MQTLVIEEKKLYGRLLLYPSNPLAKSIIRLTNRKTFSEEDLQILRETGYLIEMVGNKTHLEKDTDSIFS